MFPKFGVSNLEIISRLGWNYVMLRKQDSFLKKINYKSIPNGSLSRMSERDCFFLKKKKLILFSNTISLLLSSSVKSNFH